MQLFGLIGYPLKQSFSKKFFDEKIEKAGLTDCRFENFQLTSITEFPRLLETNPELAGLAVTIPYKKQVIQFLDNTDGIPGGLDACNCIRIDQGKLSGFNTDHTGFEKSLHPLLRPHHQNALVLGNGGAAEAVVFVLKKLGIAYNIVSRSLHHGSTLTYADLTPRLVQENTLIINTTPLGMYPNIDEYPNIPYEFLTADHLLYDLVYNPEKTTFLELGEKRGATIKNGYEMLVLQAEENWRIWWGIQMTDDR
jgi:shikimate dehydrogenase